MLSATGSDPDHSDDELRFVTFGILGRLHNPNVNIYGSPRIAMGSHGIRADKQESNLLVG